MKIVIAFIFLLAAINCFSTSFYVNLHALRIQQEQRIRVAYLAALEDFRQLTEPKKLEKTFEAHKLEKSHRQRATHTLLNMLARKIHSVQNTQFLGI